MSIFEECLPGEVLDEYGAWDYVDYVYAYHEYTIRFAEAKTKYQQEELLEYKINEMNSYILWDTENVEAAPVAKELNGKVSEITDDSIIIDEVTFPLIYITIFHSF